MFFSASPTFEIGTKASAALADLISCPGQFSFIPVRAVYRNFAKGGQKEGGGGS